MAKALKQRILKENQLREERKQAATEFSDEVETCVEKLRTKLQECEYSEIET